MGAYGRPKDIIEAENAYVAWQKEITNAGLEVPTWLDHAKDLREFKSIFGFDLKDLSVELFKMVLDGINSENDFSAKIPDINSPDNLLTSFLAQKEGAKYKSAKRFLKELIKFPTRSNNLDSKLIHGRNPNSFVVGVYSGE